MSRFRNLEKLTIAVDLVHIFCWDSADYTLLNDFWVLSYNVLDSLQILHGDL